MDEQLVVILAYHFPPENAIGGARPYRFYKYLKRLGFQCHVITAAEQTGCDDPDIEYVPDPFVEAARHTAGWQFERAVRWAFLPGMVGTLWSYHATQAARKRIREHKSSLVTIFSTFPPQGPHFAAWQLAADGYPWIADYRDPFAEATKAFGFKPFHVQCAYWIERRFLNRSTVLIANTDAAKDRWQEKLADRPVSVHLIWNGFDPEDRISPLPLPKRNHKVLSHVGELYWGRTVTPLLESFARLIDAGRLSPDQFCVRLIGPAGETSIPSPEFINRAKSQGWLDLVPEQVPQREARQIAQTSDGLLIIQPQSAVQVPGKLFEYLQIGRPILAFIPPDSAIERLLARCGVPYRCAYVGSSLEAMDAAVAGFFDLPSTAVTANQWFENEFNATNQTDTLAAIIRGLHKDPMMAATSKMESHV
jgi:hypothetical protein